MDIILVLETGTITSFTAVTQLLTEKNIPYSTDDLQVTIAFESTGDLAAFSKDLEIVFSGM